MEKVELKPSSYKLDPGTCSLWPHWCLHFFLGREERRKKVAISTFSLPRKLAVGVGLSPLGYHLNHTAPGSPFLPWNQLGMPHLG